MPTFPKPFRHFSPAASCLFQQIGGGEKAGSGIDKIRQGWASQQWRWPRIGTRVQPDRVTLTLPMVSLLPEASLKRLSEALGGEWERLNPQQVQALITADVEGSVSNQRLQQFLDSDATDISRMLTDLCVTGAI